MGRKTALILLLTGIILIGLVGVSGCTSKKPPKKNPLEEEQKKVLNNKGRLVGDIAIPANMHLAKIQGVTLIRGLPNTGSNEPPSMYQQIALKELQRNTDRKEKARDEISSLSTAIVIVEGVVPPGAQKGDRFDLEVTVPPGSEAVSIEGGYIEKANLHQYLAVDHLRESDRLGVATGFVLTNQDLVAQEVPGAQKKGVIPGGGVNTKSRPVWLEIQTGVDQTAGVAQRIEDVVNSRFSYKRNGSKYKVAEAKYGAIRINLIIPEEYKDNVNRYMNVVCAISFFETQEEQADRINSLKVKLLDPETSEFASIQLEAIGPTKQQVIEAFQAGMSVPNEQVRFNSAIAVAYMNIPKERNNAINILAQFAKTNPKYRPAALAVLGTTLASSVEVDTKLRELLSDSNEETRYGAFRALWTRNPNDYMILGEKMNGYFDYHCLNCGGIPLIHISQMKRPEIVLFAKDNIYLEGNFNFDAGSLISIRSNGNDVIVKKYQTGLDQQRIVTHRLDDVIRAIVDVGGSYPDVVQFLCKANEKKNLVALYDQNVGNCALAIDALPGSKDKYKKIRDAEELAMLTTADSQSKKEKKDYPWYNPKGWVPSSGNKEKKGDSRESSDESFGDD